MEIKNITNLRNNNGNSFFSINFYTKKINVWNSRSSFRNGIKIATFKFADEAEFNFLTKLLFKKNYKFADGKTLESIRYIEK